MAGTRAWGKGGPRGDVTQASPDQGGARQVAVTMRAGVPAAPESAERALHLQVCCWG